MSIDDLARAAAADAHRRAAEKVVPMTMLEDLHRTRRTRTVGTVVAMAAVVVTASVVSLAVVNRDDAAPATPGTTSPAVLPSGGSDDRCTDPAITCLGSDRYKVDMTVPVSVTLPANFAGAFTRFGRGTLEDYRNDVDQTGVTVFEAATAVNDDAQWSAAPEAGQTAHSMATWLSQRPFLVNATMTQTTLGGRDAWTVSATLKPGAKLPATKGNDLAVVPTFTGSGGSKAGYGEELTGDYTLVDVPGAGVTVIWSWNAQGDRSVLADNQPYIDGMSIG